MAHVYNTLVHHYYVDHSDYFSSLTGKHGSTNHHHTYLPPPPSSTMHHPPSYYHQTSQPPPYLMTTQDCVKVEPMPHKHEESPPFVHIEGLQFFDASLLEPIPFVQAATTCTSSSFAAETGEYAFEALTLECAQDFLFDAMHHDLTFPATCAASSSPSPPRVQPCNDDDDVDIPTTEFPGKCFSEGCSKSISYRGFCKDHGGVRLCSVVGCPKGNQGKRLCISHGGGKRCRISDCEKSAQSHGLCKAHGGGARCTIANCDKSSQGGGRCRKHGGGRRCSVADCSSGAQRANLCAKHGGSRLCGVPECGRTDRGGGLCENHRKDLVCKEGTCNRLAISESTDGLCLRHMRRQK